MVEADKIKTTVRQYSPADNPFSGGAYCLTAGAPACIDDVPE
jgi:hypothetical protein